MIVWLPPSVPDNPSKRAPCLFRIQQAQTTKAGELGGGVENELGIQNGPLEFADTEHELKPRLLHRVCTEDYVEPTGLV